MNNEEIILKLNEIHENDEEQLRFVLSDEKRIIVSASAGCGKTKTMISKIAYELVTNKNINYKKILALTFSVNAATKIKEDTSKIIPKLLNDSNYRIEKKLDVSNYHSFSTKILLKQGYVISENLKNMEKFLVVSEKDSKLNQYLELSELNILNDLLNALNSADVKKVDNLVNNYVDILLKKLIPNNIITFNGILILVLELFKKQSVKNFYTNYYPIIIVDEFQDTNYLALKLILNLINDNNKIFLMGDSLQKIYGFIGALPDLFNYMESSFKMMPMKFSTNYRFKDNSKMLNLDKYLRNIFEYYDNIEYFNMDAEINLGFYNTEKQENDKILTCIKEKIRDNNDVAILVNTKYSASSILEALDKDGVEYFNGLFSDTDVEYIKFHQVVLDIFISKSGIYKSSAKKILESVIEKVIKCQDLISRNKVTFESLIKLLQVLFNNVMNSNLSKEDKYNKIIFTLQANSLKRLMNEIDERVFVTTVHGSKGLEWDYVFIPQITESQFPSYKGICQDCKKNNHADQSKNNCRFTFPKELKSRFLEQLSIYYVAITRAKIDVYQFANIQNNKFGYPKKSSCLITLPNLNYNDIF